jgi:hypothetical protein
MLFKYFFLVLKIMNNYLRAEIIFGFRTLIKNCLLLEVLTAVTMKTSTFWDITPYSLLKVN